MDASTVGLLLLAALAAGFVDAVVGGGGLIQLPALLLGLPGASPIQVLATNKLASFMGTAVSAVTYRSRLGELVPEAPALLSCAFVGSLAGATASGQISREAFDPIIVVVLVVVFAVVWFRSSLGRDEPPSSTTSVSGSRRTRWVLAGLIGLVVGCYDGALGPGTGTFFVLGLVMVLGHSFVGASASAKVANLGTNLAALVVFVPAGAVLWPLGLAMGLANVIGAYLGARTAIARGSEFVRIFLLVVVAALALRLAWPMLTTWV